MDNTQQELFEQKLDARFARGFHYTAKDATGKWTIPAAVDTYIRYVEIFIENYSSGRVSDSAFEIVEKSLVESGDLKPIVVEEEPELTLQEYRSMPVRQIQLKYRNDPVFKAGVEKLIANGLI